MTQTQDQQLVRPTLRCLRDDLTEGLGPCELREFLRLPEANFVGESAILFPCSLFTIEHLVVDKANHLVNGPAADRKPIKALRAFNVTKVKTSDWRGALWEDGNGVWWLLAAGRRKDDGPGDFYRAIESRATGDRLAILPNSKDELYLRFEIAHEEELRKDKAAHAALVEAIFEAARYLESPVTTEIFGAEVAVRIRSEGPDIAALELSWDLTSFKEQDRFPHDILAMVPGCQAIETWDLIPANDNGYPTTWYIYVQMSWIDDLITSIELDEVFTHDSAPPTPSTDGSEHFSHFAAKKVVTYAYIEGVQITGLCGARVVAHRDYEGLPICAVCKGTRELLLAERPDTSGEGL